MNDIINQKLILAVQKNKINTSMLQRYFKIRFKITLGEDVLARRLMWIKRSA